jgi:hypothetical protein
MENVVRISRVGPGAVDGGVENRSQGVGGPGCGKPGSCFQDRVARTGIDIHLTVVAPAEAGIRNPLTHAGGGGGGGAPVERVTVSETGKIIGNNNGRGGAADQIGGDQRYQSVEMFRYVKLDRGVQGGGSIWINTSKRSGMASMMDSIGNLDMRKWKYTQINLHNAQPTSFCL